MAKGTKYPTNVHLTTKALAKRWGMHPGSRRHWRQVGHGPKYIKLGAKSILYPMPEILAYEEAHTFKSTAEESAKGLKTK